MSCDRIAAIIIRYRERGEGPFARIEAGSDSKGFTKAGKQSKEMQSYVTNCCNSCLKHERCEDSNADQNIAQRQPRKLLHRMGFREVSNSQSN